MNYEIFENALALLMAVSMGEDSDFRNAIVDAGRWRPRINRGVFGPVKLRHYFVFHLAPERPWVERDLLTGEAQLEIPPDCLCQYRECPRAITNS